MIGVLLGHKLGLKMKKKHFRHSLVPHGSKTKPEIDLEILEAISAVLGEGLGWRLRMKLVTVLGCKCGSN